MVDFTLKTISSTFQKSSSGETSFSDIAKYTLVELQDRDNPPEGIDMQHKEVRKVTVSYENQNSIVETDNKGHFRIEINKKDAKHMQALKIIKPQLQGCIQGFLGSM